MHSSRLKINLERWSLKQPCTGTAIYSEIFILIPLLSCASFQLDIISFDFIFLNANDNPPLVDKNIFFDFAKFDIFSISLFENNIIGSRESHRLVIEIAAESWKMGSVKKKKS